MISTISAIGGFLFACFAIYKAWQKVVVPFIDWLVWDVFERVVFWLSLKTGFWAIHDWLKKRPNYR